MQHSEETIHASLMAAAENALDTLDYALTMMESYAADNALSDQRMRNYQAMGAVWGELRKVVHAAR